LVGIAPLVRGGGERVRRALGLVAQRAARPPRSVGGVEEEGKGLRAAATGDGGARDFRAAADSREVEGDGSGEAEYGDDGLEDGGEEEVEDGEETEFGLEEGLERVRPARGLGEERLTAAARRRGYTGVPVPRRGLEEGEQAGEGGWYSTLDEAYEEAVDENVGASGSGAGLGWWVEDEFPPRGEDGVPRQEEDGVLGRNSLDVERGRGVARRMARMADEPWPRELDVWHEIPEGRAVDYDPLLKYEYRMDMDGSGRSYVKVSRAAAK